MKSKVVDRRSKGFVFYLHSTEVEASVNVSWTAQMMDLIELERQNQTQISVCPEIL